MRRAHIWGWARTRRCDEPLNDLGPSSRHQSYPDCIIATHGYDFREGQLVSEDLDELFELADRIVVIFNGRFVYEAPASQADPLDIGRHMAGHQAVAAE